MSFLDWSNILIYFWCVQLFYFRKCPTCRMIRIPFVIVISNSQRTRETNHSEGHIFGESLCDCIGQLLCMCCLTLLSHSLAEAKSNPDPEFLGPLALIAELAYFRTLFYSGNQNWWAIPKHLLYDACLHKSSSCPTAAAPTATTMPSRSVFPNFIALLWYLDQCLAFTFLLSHSIVLYGQRLLTGVR